MPVPDSSKTLVMIDQTLMHKLIFLLLLSKVNLITMTFFTLFFEHLKI